MMIRENGLNTSYIRVKEVLRKTDDSDWRFKIHSGCHLLKYQSLQKSSPQDTFHPNDKFLSRSDLGKLFFLTSSSSFSPPLHYF